MFIGDSSNIPEDEQKRFAKHIFRFFDGSVIIQEGEDDNAIYLLREGTVVVEKIIGEKPTRISTIEAVNFFGEMAMIVGSKRTATIRVISPQAIVYKFQSFDLRSIYTNPAWSELLITRLCNDLIETNARATLAEGNHIQQTEKINRLIQQSSMLFAALLTLQGNIAADMLVNTRDWKLVHGMRELTENFLKTNLPEIYAQINLENDRALKTLEDQDGFPDVLKH